MSLQHRLEAWSDLWARYRDVFRYFWQHRRELTAPALQPHEAEFLPAALSLQAQPVSPMGRWVARILIALVACVLLWSYIGKIDITVSAHGKIIPSGYTKTIAAVEVGSVRALHVQEGQAVKAGDLLIELDTRQSDSDRDKAESDRQMALLQAARSRGLIDAVDSGKEPSLERIAGIPADRYDDAARHLQGQWLDYMAKLQTLEGEIKRYSEALPLVSQRALDYSELAKEHNVSTHAWLEKEQARIDLEGQLAEATNQRSALVAETRRTAQDALNEAVRTIASSGQDARRASVHSELLKLLAPVEGTVQQLTVHTVGGVVPAAQPLMQIVPKQSLVEVEAFLENKDVGFVQEGQKAEVKIDAFDYTKYGTIPARVSHVSHDAIDDEKKGLIYSVKVTVDKSVIRAEGSDMPLVPGLSTNVEIQTGRRRLIEYVLSPLIEHGRESMHER